MVEKNQDSEQTEQIIASDSNAQEAQADATETIETQKPAKATEKTTVAAGKGAAATLAADTGAKSVTSDKNPDEIIQNIVQGYTFDGAAVNIGVAMADDTVYPEAKVNLPLKMMNRHGLIAGATGTGKTVTLQTIAEQLSQQGVPSFISDVKGDLTGIASPGVEDQNIQARTQETGQEWQPYTCPTEIFSLGGQGGGVPIRATLTSFGPLLLSRIMELNDTQESSLQLLFHYADQKHLDLLGIKDLQAVIQYLQSDKGKPELKEIGGIDGRTLGVIVRKLTTLEANGLDAFFGEPEFDTADLIKVSADGQGVVNLLELKDVYQNPMLFSTFLIWLVTDLFEHLPEVGDQDKPKLVFFLDEAHLLFKNASSAFLTAITQTVRLIRSKGVGIFFCTQTPKDVDDDVLAQLANRVQHALRSYTPDDAKALKATVSTFPYSDYDLSKLLTTLGTGEAVVTVMNETGAPTPVAWTKVRTPESKLGPSDASVIAQIEQNSQLMSHYQSADASTGTFENLNPQAQAATQVLPTADSTQVATVSDQAIDAEAQRIQAAVMTGQGDVQGQMPVADVTQQTAAVVNQQAQPLQQDIAEQQGQGAAEQLQQQDNGVGGLVAGVAGALGGSAFLKSAERGFGRQFGTNLARSLFGTTKRSRRK
ncbi:MAG: DUF853 family protein [Micrococcaceae bacterium]